MAEVQMRLPDGQELVAAITRSSAEHLGLKEGDEVTAIIKATEIMVATDSM
jgi:molybdopterin-binding protein